MQKKGKARQGKTNPPAHAKQSWQGGKKMGKGGQENEALTTPCAHGLGCFRLLLLFVRPSVRPQHGVEKETLGGGPVSFSQSSGRLLYSYEDLGGTSAQIR